MKASASAIVARAAEPAVAKPAPISKSTRTIAVAAETPAPAASVPAGNAQPVPRAKPPAAAGAVRQVNAGVTA